jgi:group I intron endonuclease
MNFIVYKHTNKINNKAYIGYTSHSLEHRWIGHIKTRNRKCAFARALKKYGTDCDVWTHEILETLTDSSVELAKQKEVYWIAYYDTYRSGYNETKGGEGPENSKISASLKNHKLSQETKEKISKSQLGEKNHNFGKQRKKETCLAISNAHKGKKLSQETKNKISLKKQNVRLTPEHKIKLSKRIDQYDLEGNYIKTFDSLTHASKDTSTNINYISRCLHNKLQQKNKKRFDWCFHTQQSE